MTVRDPPEAGIGEEPQLLTAVERHRFGPVARTPRVASFRCHRTPGRRCPASCRAGPIRRRSRGWSTAPLLRCRPDRGSSGRRRTAGVGAEVDGTTVVGGSVVGVATVTSGVNDDASRARRAGTVGSAGIHDDGEDDDEHDDDGGSRRQTEHLPPFGNGRLRWRKGGQRGRRRWSRCSRAPFGCHGERRDQITEGVPGRPVPKASLPCGSASIPPRLGTTGATGGKPTLRRFVSHRGLLRHGPVDRTRRGAAPCVCPPFRATLCGRRSTFHCQRRAPGRAPAALKRASSGLSACPVRASTALGSVRRCAAGWRPPSCDRRDCADGAVRGQPKARTARRSGGGRPSSGTWLAGEGSNLQHPAPKAGVLPIELPAKGRCTRYTVGRQASINSMRFPKGSST